MSEINRLNIKLSAGKRDRSKLIVVPVSMQDITEHIRSKGYDEYTTSELIKKAATYPQAALRNFAHHLPQHIATITKLKYQEEEDPKNNTKE